MSSMRASMRDDASIWAVWPKGRPELKEKAIRDHALHIDLVDVRGGGGEAVASPTTAEM